MKIAKTTVSKVAKISEKVREFAMHWFELNDAFWISGLSAVGYGVAQIYVPAAWIVCGAVLFWMGVKK